MRSFPECEECNCNSKIPIKEPPNRSEIIFLNPDAIAVRKIKVDGCVIKDNKTLRCDYILIPGDDVEIYIELKGSDINHAVKQIESTIRKLSENPAKLKKLCFIVSTRVPKQGTNTQNLQVQFKKKFNASFRVKNTPHTYDLKDLRKD